MKYKKRETLEWRKLDNSAKIFPISTGKKYSNVFRLSVVLKEKINPEILDKAVKIALEKYKSFKVRLKDGFFWNYLEHNIKEPIIEIEKEYPCKYINPKTNNGYLFKVTYFDKKINIDIFHTLTDGNNGSVFFREIVYNIWSWHILMILRKNKEDIEKLNIQWKMDILQIMIKKLRTSVLPKKHIA